VRVDKLTLAALQATLQLYAEGRELEIPTLRYISRSVEEIRTLARTLAKSYKGAVVEKGSTEIGGGSAPGAELPTWRVALPSDNPSDLTKRLRKGDPPIIGRIEDGKVWLDPRTLEPGEAKIVAQVLRSL
jgi:L-seryl-tRNA(Ser) seleniumtransferase